MPTDEERREVAARLRAMSDEEGRWRAAAMRWLEVQFTPNERDIAEHALAQPTFSGYVKRLIREDMERTNAQR